MSADRAQNMPLPTIAADEDMTVGFMLADPTAPTDPDERVRRFAELAATEWDVHYDPAEVDHRYSKARPYRMGEDEESMVECEATDAQEWWFVFDLPDEIKPCALCGQYLSHDAYCELLPEDDPTSALPPTEASE